MGSDVRQRMKRKQKIIIILILLAVPVSVILFLHTFGRNEFSIPVFYQEGMRSAEDCPANASPHVIPDFNLTSQNTDQLSQHILEGHISVVNFFEVQCENNCSQIAAALATVQDNFANKELVRLLSISTRNNNPSELDQFSDKYYSKPNKWLLLTGATDQVEYLAKCGFGLSDKNNPPYPINTVVLVDPAKRIRGYYDLTNDEETGRLELEIRVLLYDMEK